MIATAICIVMARNMEVWSKGLVSPSRADRHGVGGGRLLNLLMEELGSPVLVASVSHIGKGRIILGHGDSQRPLS